MNQRRPHLMGSLSPNVTRYHIVVWNPALCITANLAANVSVGSTSAVSGFLRHGCFTPECVAKLSLRRLAISAQGRLAFELCRFHGRRPRPQSESRKRHAADRGATRYQRCERGARMDLGMAGCRHRRRTKPGAGRRIVRCRRAPPHARRPPGDRRRDCRGRRREWPHPSATLTLR